MNGCPLRTMMHDAAIMMHDAAIIFDNHNEAQQAILFQEIHYSAAAATTIVIASVTCATLAYFTKVNHVAHCCCAAIIAPSITITIGIFLISS
mmetsp:Transcript_7138/g.11201  ORF Transcript_7138/g.11201 Transcript_7138/m.11201 type:complete len:93 (-) Transcript_7138:65-343(-)